MLRILAFLAVIVAIGGGLAFIAAEGGELVLLVAGMRIVLPLFTAVCLALGLLATILFLWWLVRIIIGAPHAIRSHFGAKRLGRGYQALSQGLLAAMSGDAVAAKRLTKQSQALLSSAQEPLVPLLAAETKRLELDYHGAEEIFHSMLDRPQTRLIGLKGLYREAMRKGDEAQARIHAEQAIAIDAALEWAARATITQYAAQENWHEALALFERHDLARRKGRRIHKKSDMMSWRAALLCAKARDELADNKPELARDDALQAHKLMPDFVPAVAFAAQSLFRLDERKKAERLIEGFWRKNPHPDLGSLYLDGVPDASVKEKLQRARRLEKLKSDDPVAKMLVAQAALQAGDLPMARAYAEKLAEELPCEGVFLLLADIHVALGSDSNQIRHYLTQAVHAPADFTWMADGQITGEWVAIAPLSQRIGVCEWQQPLKHAPPLLALPAIKPEAEPSHHGAIVAPAAHSAIVAPETIEESVIAPPTKEEIKTKPTKPSQPTKAPPPTPTSPAVFLTDQEPVEEKPHSLRPPALHPNGITPPPTRIIVDDPGIAEDENKP